MIALEAIVLRYTIFSINFADWSILKNNHDIWNLQS